MHRSGTSALAGLLHTNGICMGEPENFIPKPAPENPKGFYENIRFRRVNDMILADNEYWVKTFSPMVPDVIQLKPRHIDIMKQLIYEYNTKYDNWGFKDPRTCLTYAAWAFVFKELNLKFETILSYREYDSIVKSMRARGNAGPNINLMALTNAYYRCFLKHLTNSEPNKMIIVNFDNLIHRTKAVAKDLSTELNYKIKNLSFIDPKLKKS